MKLQPIILRIETFNWTSEDGKTTIAFPVTKMLSEISVGRLKVDRVTTEISEPFIVNWLSKRELNLKHVSSLSLERLDEPVLGAWMADDVLLIDGSHRYLARYVMGFKTIDYLLVSEPDWRPFVTETSRL